MIKFTIALLLTLATTAKAQEFHISEEHREQYERSLFTLAFASGCSHARNDPQLLQDATELLARTLRNAEVRNPETTARSMSEAAYARSETPQAEGVNVYNERTCTSLTTTIAKRLAE